MIYKTVIKYLPTFTSGGVSNTNTYMIEVTCELPRDTNPDKPIVPLTETVTQSAQGQYVVTLHFFRYGNKNLIFFFKNTCTRKTGAFFSLAFDFNA